MPPSPEISVVIPVYASAAILPSLVTRLESTLASISGKAGYEVILVHDCGPDDSWRVIAELTTSRPWLRALDLRHNAGQHNAIMAGLSVVHGKFIITMDDDLQHAPEDLPRILEALHGGADLCYAGFPEKHHALWKRFGSRFNDLVAQWLLKKPKGLYLSPYRGFIRDLSNEAIRYQGPFVYLDGLLLQGTNRIAAISVEHHPRSDGRSGYSLRKSISLWLQMATSFSVAPLRLVSLAGAVTSGIAFVMAIVTVIQKMITPQIAVGWTSLIVTILLIGGMQLLALGAIGEYVGRILLNAQKRPQFVVRSRIN